MRWNMSLAWVLVLSLWLTGCGADSQPVAENGTPQSADTSDPAGRRPRARLAESVSDTLGAMAGQAQAPQHPDSAPQTPGPDNTAADDSDPGAPDPGKVQVEATADTVGTKGKGYGGGIITEPIHQYFRQQDKLKLQQIEYGLKLYHAEHGRYPATMQQFVDEILTPQQVKLPELPPGRKFVYDPQQGKVLVQFEQQ